MSTDKLEQYVRENPKPQFYTNAVSTLLKSKDLEKAEELIQEGLENFPEDRILWSQYGDVLSAFGEASDLIEAIKAYEKAIELGNTRAVDFDVLEKARTALREKTPALSAVFDETATAKIYMGIASERRRNGREEEAITLFQEAVTVFPEDHVLWYQLGKTLSFEKRFEEAAEALQKSIDIKPDDRLTREAIEANRQQMQRHNRRN